MIDVLEAECRQEDLLTLALQVEEILGDDMRMFLTGPAIVDLDLVWLLKSEVAVQAWIEEALDDSRLGVILQEDTQARYHGSSWEVLFVNGRQTHLLHR